MMRRQLFRAIVLLTLSAPCAAAEPSQEVEPLSPREILDDIRFLSDDMHRGRYARSEEARAVAKWIGEQFAQAGLTPLDDRRDFFFDVTDPTMAPNVVGIRPGTSDAIILITAHYDHLGTKQADPRQANQDAGHVDLIFNGADDNASGVAGMLAVARALADRPALEASVVFIAFTGEEAGLRGSRHFAGEPPFDLRRVKGMFNLDMISRGREDLIFVDGSKRADPLRHALREANKRHQIGLTIRFDEHPDWLHRSDQGPFIRRNVPAVLLSVEDHPDYHQVTDHADRVIPELAARVSRLVLEATLLLDKSTSDPIDTLEP